MKNYEEYKMVIISFEEKDAFNMVVAASGDDEPETPLEEFN